MRFGLDWCVYSSMYTERFGLDCCVYSSMYNVRFVLDWGVYSSMYTMRFGLDWCVYSSMYTVRFGLDWGLGYCVSYRCPYMLTLVALLSNISYVTVTEDEMYCCCTRLRLTNLLCSTLWRNV